MSLHVLHSLLLLGTLFAAVPVALHLFFRRKALKVPFPPIRFVLLSNRRTARGLKIRQWLLLLARFLLALLLPLVLARPFCAPADFASGENMPVGATVVLMDDSLSMQLRAGGESMFDRGRRLALEALRRLDGRDEAALVFFCAAPDAPTPSLGFDRAPLLKALEEAKPTPRSCPLDAAVERAAEVVAQSTREARRIWIVSDFARGGVRLDARPLAGRDPAPSVRLIDAGEGLSPPDRANVGIVGLSAERAPLVGSDAYRIGVTALNAAPVERRSLRVALTIESAAMGAPSGGAMRELAGGFYDLGPGERTDKPFTRRFDERGFFPLAARIEPDALALDDVRHAGLNIGRDARVLMVNGEPSTTPHKDEIFYLEKALDPLKTGLSRIRVDVAFPDATLDRRFADFDLVMLLNVSSLPDRAAKQLADWVTGGGALWIGVGPQMKLDWFNTAFAALLPGDLLEPKSARPETDAAQVDAALSFDRIDFAHPILEPFKADEGRSLYAARFRMFMPIRPDPTRAKQILLRYSNLQPAVVLTRPGKGRVLLYTATVDRAWTDWPIRPSFLPFVQESVRFLTGLGFDEGGHEYTPGQVATVNLPDGARTATLIAPDGTRATLIPQPVEDKPDALRVRTPPLVEPGVYRVEFDAGRMVSMAVNPDPAESDTRPLTDAELAKLLAPDSTPDAVAALLERGAGHIREWWKTLLVLLLLAMASETLLSWSLGRPPSARGAADASSNNGTASPLGPPSPA